MKRPGTIWNVLLAGMSAMVLGSCGFLDHAPSTPGETGATGASAYVTGGYKIGPEDILEVIVWRNADLTKTVAVRPDGKISLPLVGDVTAVGLTADQLTKEINTRMKDFKESPNVLVVVKEINSYSVYVMGEVLKPSRYQLKSYTTVLQAISIAGGFTPFAAKDKMFVLRKSADTGVETRLNVSYKDITSGGDSTKNIVLVPGDTVVVP